jgi:hypothetical protein
MHGFEVSALGGIMAPDSSSLVTAPSFYGTNSSAVAIGDVLAGTYKPYGIDPFGLAFAAGYRFLPWLSAGIDFQFASFNALGGTDTGSYVDGTSQLQRRAYSLGVYGRYYFTQFHAHLHPWAELGLGYSGDSASYTRGGNQGNRGIVTESYYLTESGVDLRLKIGLDWRLAPVFAVGPWASYERIVPIQACAEIDVDTGAPPFQQQYSGQNRCTNPPVQGSSYGLAAAGIFAKVTFDPF